MLCRDPVNDDSFINAQESVCRVVHPTTTACILSQVQHFFSHEVAVVAHCVMSTWAQTGATGNVKFPIVTPRAS